jgi:flavin reductase (DIM6/NTAB) family NADH-FMN oxidoreductase RutF
MTKRPWNLTNLPIYSLATYGDDGFVNMNICTYVIPVSMSPKLYAIAIYEGTKSLSNLQQNAVAVLQLLHIDQIKLVQALGMKSGKTYNKSQYLQKKNLITTWNGDQVLANAAAYLNIKGISSQVTGDHHLFLFEVMSYKSCSQEILTEKHLRQAKIIRT